jgi:hypothetical protein
MRATPHLYAAVLFALALAGCGPASPGPTQTVDGLRFDFATSPVEQHVASDHVHRVEAGYDYRVGLALSDAKTGERIPDAKVHVDILGLGHPPGAATITMVPATVRDGAGYSHELVFRYASTYRLTFSATLPGGHHTPVEAAFLFRRPK